MMFKRRSKKSPDSITDAVKDIRSDLKRFNNFLEEADTVEYEEGVLKSHVEQVKAVTEKIKDVLLDYADAVEHKQIPIIKKRGIQKILKGICCRSETKDPFSSLISDIDKIKDEIRSINRSAKSHGVSEGIKQVLEENHRNFRRNISREVEKVYIDITDDIDKVITMLMSPEINDHFVSLFGEAGSGKTTIAKKVYERHEVRQAFQCFAWMDIKQESQVDAQIVLQDLVEMLMEGASSSSEELINKSTNDKFQFLLDHYKCLIVLDDVWSLYELRFLLRYVHRTRKPMSKVLITTRVHRVAEIGQFCEPRTWNQTESWDLLYKISMIDAADAETDMETIGRLEHIGRQIVDKCGGLPLAVATIGGILRTTPTSVNEWEKVLAGIPMYLKMGGGSGSLEVSFALIYNSLPFRLKPCFLYMALFLKDEPIEASRLCHFWIAEGLVSEEDSSLNETLMDVAKRNLSELEFWGMIKVVRRNEANEDIEWCEPVKKDVLDKKAKDEGFFETFQIHSSDGKAQTKAQALFNKKARRLVMQSGASKYLNEMQSVRVLIVSSDSDFSAIDTVGKFKYLKAIEFDGCSFPDKQLPKEIFNILTLKYLLLNPTHDITLPLDAPCFPYIQTLNLLGSYAIYVPDILGKMKSLKHLYLGYGCRPLDSGKLKLLELDQLEILDIRNGGMVSLEDLPKLGNLHFLGIDIDTDDLVDGMMYISQMANKPKWVRIATEVPVDYISVDGPKRLGRLLEFDKVNELVIKGSFELPPYEPHFWRNVSRLLIEETLIKGDPMKLLKHLPALKELRFEYDEFMTDEIECDANAFPQLESLRLKWCSHLKKWRVHKKAFPKLSSLIIEGCQDLKEIVPEEGLRNLHALKDLHFHQMPEEFNKYNFRPTD